MFKNLFNRFNNKVDNSTNEDLVKVFTDSMGNEWYSYKNILDIMPARGLSAARAERFASLKISEGNFVDIIDVAIDGINKDQNITQAIAILHELKIRSKFMVEENSVLDLAAIYYFLQDENPLFPSESHNIKKRDIWAKDEICKGFFLHMGLGLTKNFSGMPEEDLLTFIRKTVDTAERIYQYIPRT